MIARAALLTLAAAATAATAAAGQTPLAVRPAAGTGAPVVTLGPVLADDALEQAVRSGLPLRMRFTVELWKDELFDDLVARRTWTAVLAFEPLERAFVVGGDAADSVARFDSWTAARAALETSYRPAARPREAGPHYYLATLEVETLSLSDLEELQRWLQGDLQPAVQGGRSFAGALASGVKRLFIRVLDLPARRFQARSERFLAR